MRESGKTKKTVLFCFIRMLMQDLILLTDAHLFPFFGLWREKIKTSVSTPDVENKVSTLSLISPYSIPDFQHEGLNLVARLSPCWQESILVVRY